MSSLESSARAFKFSLIDIIIEINYLLLITIFANIHFGQSGKIVFSRYNLYMKYKLFRETTFYIRNAPQHSRNKLSKVHLQIEAEGRR